MILVNQEFAFNSIKTGKIIAKAIIENETMRISLFCFKARFAFCVILNLIKKSKFYFWFVIDDLSHEFHELTQINFVSEN